MVKYDPNNPLSDEELDKLGKEDFDKFLEYLDSKTAYLKQFSKPLDAYHLKRFAAQDMKDKTGEMLGVEELKKLQKQGNENSKMSDEEIEKHEEWMEKRNEMLKKTFGFKNFKTHRSQWFD